MPWISIKDEGKATGQLKEIYEELKGKRGKISNIMRVQSLNPGAMKAHLNLYINLMFGQSGLSREDREMIAVVVSAANGCEYCVNHHAESLNHYWKDSERIQQFIKDFNPLELAERTSQMLNYAVKLTKTPKGVHRSDIYALRECGFSDEDILNINLIVSYFNFVNRIANGLGVEFTPEEVQGYKL
ncbi:peroxidase-related enzyme [candidate division KSB1 bacterium]|nr:peroxidase-related enzyme [candidate division KSB1 bacterium]